MTESMNAPGFAPARTRLTSRIIPCMTVSPSCSSLFAQIESATTSPCSTRVLAFLPCSVSLNVPYVYIPSSRCSSTALPRTHIGSLWLWPQTRGTVAPSISLNAPGEITLPSEHLRLALVAHPLKSNLLSILNCSSFF